MSSTTIIIVTKLAMRFWLWFVNVVDDKYMSISDQYAYQHEYKWINFALLSHSYMYAQTTPVRTGKRDSFKPDAHF